MVFGFTLYGGRSECLKAAFWLSFIGVGVLLSPDHTALVLFLLVTMLLLGAVWETLRKGGAR